MRKTRRYSGPTTKQRNEKAKQVRRRLNELKKQEQQRKEVK